MWVDIKQVGWKLFSKDKSTGEHARENKAFRLNKKSKNILLLNKST